MDAKIKKVKKAMVKGMSGLLKSDKKMDAKMASCEKGMKKMKSKTKR